ncbi:MAG: molybdenum cofactor guanylyltransferase [Ignavibacteriales bacterium]|nr:molybdenum cofactor guanylyltransferase [Ignavibacteriales bacterium]
MKIPGNIITGVILSNRNSEQLAVNNSLLKIDDKTLIERLFELLKQTFEQVIICTNEPELYNFIDAKKIKNLFPNFGTLAGIHSALTSTAAEKIFITSCDIPFLVKPLIDFLIEHKSGESIVIPSAKEKVEYLCGIYDRRLLPIVEKILNDISEAGSRNQHVKSSAFSLWNFVERIGADIVNVEFEKWYFNDLFFDINSPEDWEYAKEKLI